MTKTYKKLVATEFGKDFRRVSKVVEDEIPAPEAGQVVLKVKYASVNASDINIAAGIYFTDGQQPPFGLGADFAGEIVSVGEGVEHLKVGDKAVGVAIGMGYREYACVPAASVFPVPLIARNSTILLTSGLPAIIGLEEVGQMKSDETVLVTTAAGGVGHLAVQLAKIAGNHVIAVTGSDSKVSFLKGLGADRVINYRKENLDEVLGSEYSKGIDLVFENVGKEVFDTCVKHIATRGRVVVCGAISEYQSSKPERVTAPRIYHSLLFKSASIRAFLFSDFPELIPSMMQKLTELMMAGKLQVVSDETVFQGVESVPDAVDFMYDGKNIGKIVVDIS